MALTDRIDGQDEDAAFWRRLTLPEEDRLRLLPMTTRPGYRWFRSANIVCLEHFRRPHTTEQKAGRFGWINSCR